MDKDAVALVFTQIATLLDLKGENLFKVRAYQNAARTLELLQEPLSKLVAEDRLKEIRGLGEALQEKVRILVTTGQLPYYDELKASLPAGLLGLLEIPGLGPKKVKALYEKLSVTCVEQLEAVCLAGQVADLAGFGAKTQEKILLGIAFRKTHVSRHHLSTAWQLSEPILESLRFHPDALRCSTAGSLRRHKEAIGDIDFLVSSQKPGDVIHHFTNQPGVKSITAAGDTKASVVLEGGMQCDLRVVSDTEFPFALAYFTGSKEHNIVMRQRAIERGLRLNEYGLFRSTVETRDPALRMECQTEEHIFEKLDLPYIPPELREGTWEFDAANAGEPLPRLVEWTELKGSLHNHSEWSDGRGSLDEIAEAMEDLGFAYWAITDHSKSSFQAHGLDAERLRKQAITIRQINARLRDEGREFRLLTGSEVDILSEGRLDFENPVLEELEVVVASIHQGFTASESEMTKRIIKAVENPNVHILGHLTGRLLLERPSYAVNQQAVIDACAETGTWIELNANPYRLDMDWRLWPYARKKGVQCVINADAHRHEHAGFLRLGAGIARKGWLTKSDVINTQPLPVLAAALAKKRSRSPRS